MTTINDARVAKRLLLDKLSKPSWLVGLGLTKINGTYALKVIGLLGLEEASYKLPEEINGVGVMYEESGPVRKRQS